MEKLEKSKYNRGKTINFHTALKPMFSLLKYIGLAPYSFVTVKHGDESVTTTVQNSWAATGYSVSVTLLLCICILVSLTGRVKYTYLTMPAKVVVPDFLVWVTLSICACSSLILGVVFRKRMARVLDTISQIDQNLLENLTHTYISTSIITTAMSIIIFCLITALICMYFLWTVELSGIKFMILVLPGYIAYFINNLMVLLFVCLVTLIWHRYRALNFHLTTKNTSFTMHQALNVLCDISTSEHHQWALKKNGKDHTIILQYIEDCGNWTI